MLHFKPTIINPSFVNYNLVTVIYAVLLPGNRDKNLKISYGESGVITEHEIWNNRLRQLMNKLVAA